MSPPVSFTTPLALPPARLRGHRAGAPSGRIRNDRNGWKSSTTSPAAGDLAISIWRRCEILSPTLATKAGHRVDDVVWAGCGCGNFQFTTYLIRTCTCSRRMGWSCAVQTMEASLLLPHCRHQSGKAGPLPFVEKSTSGTSRDDSAPQGNHRRVRHFKRAYRLTDSSDSRSLRTDT